MEEFKVTVYPEGVERFKEERLAFLPTDEARENFLDTVLQLLMMG